MAKYEDFSFNRGLYNKAEEYKDAAAVVLAIKNILLSRPGNFPFTPSLGLDLERYLFEPADEQTLNQIKTDLSDQISRYIPGIEGVTINISVVEDDKPNMIPSRNVLGISIKASVGSETIDTNFLAYHDFDGLIILNESH